MRKLARDIKLIAHVSSELASGGQVSNGHVPVLPEAQKIVKSIRKIQDDLHHSQVPGAFLQNKEKKFRTGYRI